MILQDRSSPQAGSRATWMEEACQGVGRGGAEAGAMSALPSRDGRWQGRRTTGAAICRPSHVQGIAEPAINHRLQTQSMSEAAMGRILHGKRITEPAMNRHLQSWGIAGPALDRFLQGRGRSEAVRDRSFHKTVSPLAPALRHSAAHPPDR